MDVVWLFDFNEEIMRHYDETSANCCANNTLCASYLNFKTLLYLLSPECTCMCAKPCRALQCVSCLKLDFFPLSPAGLLIGSMIGWLGRPGSSWRESASVASKLLLFSALAYLPIISDCASLCPLFFLFKKEKWR